MGHHDVVAWWRCHPVGARNPRGWVGNRRTICRGCTAWSSSRESGGWCGGGRRPRHFPPQLADLRRTGFAHLSRVGAELPRATLGVGLDQSRISGVRAPSQTEAGGWAAPDHEQCGDELPDEAWREITVAQGSRGRAPTGSAPSGCGLPRGASPARRYGLSTAGTWTAANPRPCGAASCCSRQLRLIPG